MKLKDALSTASKDEIINLAKGMALHHRLSWDTEVRYIFNTILDDHDRAPGNIGGKNDNLETLIEKWLMKYKNGFNGRASQRTSNPPGTVSDPILETIMGARLNQLPAEDLNHMIHAHRISMSAENILGSILEEYLATHLLQFGWHCAWGETVKAVDFVHQDGRLLQIKNRSNSENSSSSAVRNGTTIQKWYRIKAERVEYMWAELNSICGCNLSEADFSEFTQMLIQNNQNCLAIEQGNTWT